MGFILWYTLSDLSLLLYGIHSNNMSICWAYSDRLTSITHEIQNASLEPHVSIENRINKDLYQKIDRKCFLFITCTQASWGCPPPSPRERCTTLCYVSNNNCYYFCFKGMIGANHHFEKTTICKVAIYEELLVRCCKAYL